MQGSRQLDQVRSLVGTASNQSAATLAAEAEAIKRTRQALDTEIDGTTSNTEDRRVGKGWPWER